MGVLTMEVEKMNKTLIENQKKVEKLTKQLEKTKEQKKTQKEYERGLKKAVEHDCIECMRRDFEKEGFTNACINLQLVTTRQAILENIPESELERQYLDDNYERIFNKVKKIYANNEKAKMQAEQLKAQQEEQARKNTTVYKVLAVLGVIGLIILLILKWALIFSVGACIFVFILICMCAKDR